MNAVLYNGPKDFEYKTKSVPIPIPQSGQVLVKVDYAPINPSDTYLLNGYYNGDYDYPYIPGNEGSGTVISSGGGIMAWSLIGKRVAFVKETDRAGKFTKAGLYA